MSALQRLFAPFLPFVAAEVWSWWQGDSIDLTSWPTAKELQRELGTACANDGLEVISDVLRSVRKAKSEARLPMRARVQRPTVRDTPYRLAALDLAFEDLREAGALDVLERVPSGTFHLQLRFAPQGQ